jgi:hypothetical protein
LTTASNFLADHYFIQPANLHNGREHGGYVARWFFALQSLLLHKAVFAVSVLVYTITLISVVVLLVNPGMRNYFKGAGSILGNFAICNMAAVGYWFILGQYRQSKAGYLSESSDLNTACVPGLSQDKLTTPQRMHLLFQEIHSRYGNINEDSEEVSGLLSTKKSDIASVVWASTSILTGLFLVYNWLASKTATPAEMIMGMGEAILTSVGCIGAGVGFILFTLEASLLVARVKLFNKELLAANFEHVGGLSLDQQILQSQKSQQDLGNLSSSRLSNPSTSSATTSTYMLTAAGQGSFSTWSVQQVQTWMKSNVEGVTQEHLDKYATRVLEEDLDGEAMCRIQPQQLQVILGSTFGDDIKITRARSKIMEQVAGFQDTDELLAEYIRMKNYFDAASEAWQTLCLLVMLCGMLAFFIGVVLMVLHLQPFVVSFLEMIIGLGCFFFIVASVLYANNACTSVLGVVTGNHPRNFAFFEGGQHGLIEYFQLNKLYFIIFGFAITPAWVFGFATGGGGTTLFALLYSQFNSHS